MLPPTTAGVYLAVKKVLPYTLSYATDATIVAMIDAFTSIIVPKFTCGTVIMRRCFSTPFAVLGGWLGMTA